MIYPKFKFAAVLIVASTLTAFSARAAEPDAESLKIAKSILEVTHASTNADEMVGRLIKAMGAGLAQNHPEQGQLIQDLLSEILVPEFHNSMPELMEMSAKSYADNFTLDQLKQLLAFYQTDLGKVYIAKLPAVMREQSETGQAFAKTLMIRVQPKIVKALQDRGLQPK